MERLIFMLKKRFLLLFLVFLLTGCGYKKDNEINNSITNDEKENINGTDEIMREEKEPIDDKINSMTLDEKIGQMIITGFDGSEYNDDMDRLINEYKVGGVILFARNIEDSNQMIELTRALQENNNNIPLFISIDEEGGRVSRLPDDIEKFPAAFDIGLINNDQTAYENGKEIGYTLKRLGINLDYAPVLDIYSNLNNTVIGDRAFGTEESIVSKMGIATMKGIEDAGVIPVIKHFPGHEGDYWQFGGAEEFTIRIEPKEKGHTYNVYGWGDVKELIEDYPFEMQYNSQTGRLEVAGGQELYNENGKTYTLYGRYQSFGSNIATIKKTDTFLKSTLLRSNTNFTIYGLNGTSIIADKKLMIVPLCSDSNEDNNNLKSGDKHPVGPFSFTKVSDLY